ncbi:hypothetical protein ACFL5E_02725 [Candidatus Omnitrophota bacterium]
MLAGDKGYFYRIVCLILIVTFLSWDISWAYPERVSVATQKLSAELSFQPGVMDGGRSEFRASLFSDMKVLLSVHAVADYLFGDESKGEKPLPTANLESVLRSEVGEIVEGIDLSGVENKGGVITIPLIHEGKKCEIRIVKKEDVSAKELPGEEWGTSDKYVIKVQIEGQIAGTSEEHQGSVSQDEESEGTLKKKPAPEIDKDPEDGSHAFKARDGYVAAIITGIFTVIAGIPTLLLYMAAQGELTGTVYLALGITGYLGLAAAKYFLIGQSTRDTFVIDGKYDKDKAFTEVIASRDGYRHKVFDKLPAPVGKAVETHEGFRSHFLGMLSMLPLLWIFSIFQYKAALAKARLYKMALSGKPEYLYEAVRFDHKDINEKIYKYIETTDDIDSLSGLLVLTFGRDLELQEKVLERIFSEGIPIVQKAIEKCFTTTASSVFDYLHPVALVSRKYIREPMSSDLAGQLSEMISERSDLDTVISLAEYYFWEDGKSFSKLETLAKASDGTKKAFLAEKIFQGMKNLRNTKTIIDERYERRASDELAETITEAYGTPVMDEAKLRILMTDIEENYRAQSDMTSAYTFALMHSKDAAGLRRTMERKIRESGRQGKVVKRAEIKKYIIGRFNAITQHNGQAVGIQPIPGCDRTAAVSEGERQVLSEEDAMILLIGLERLAFLRAGDDIAVMESRINEALSEVVKVIYTEQRTISEVETQIGYKYDAREAKVESPSLSISCDLDLLDQMIKQGGEGKGTGADQHEEESEEDGQGTVGEAARIEPNNSRTKIVMEANELATYLPGHLGPAIEGAGNMTTAEIKDAVERLLGKIDEMRWSQGDIKFAKRFTALEESVRGRIHEFEAEGIVSALIILARKAKREGQNLIIGFETKWIPGFDDDALQHMAINPLIQEIRSIAKKMRDMGLDNVQVIEYGGDQEYRLADEILDAAIETNTDLSNVVVLASAATINSQGFEKLRSTEDEQRAFLAGIDTSEISDFSGTNEELYIRITEMLSIALELAAGKSAPGLSIIKEYNKALRTVIFLPKAEPVDYEKLQEMYKLQQSALIAA